MPCGPCVRGRPNPDGRVRSWTRALSASGDCAPKPNRCSQKGAATPPTMNTHRSNCPNTKQAHSDSCYGRATPTPQWSLNPTAPAWPGRRTFGVTRRGIASCTRGLVPLYTAATPAADRTNTRSWFLDETDVPRRCQKQCKGLRLLLELVSIRGNQRVIKSSAR